MSEEIKQGWDGLASIRVGFKPNYSNCGQRMFAHWSAYQYGNPAKHDPNDEGMPTRCGVHCKSAVEKRRVKADQKTKETEKLNAERYRARLLGRAEIQALIQISKGHNDPRRLAIETLENLGVNET